MNNALPKKLQTIFDQFSQLITPVAVKAAGAVTVVIKRPDEEEGPDKRAIFIRHFKNDMHALFEQLLIKPTQQETAEKKKLGSSKEAMEERISKYSLMDTELLEAHLIAERLSASLQSENQFDIDCFGLRLEKFCGITFDREKNPLQAKHLTLVFRKSCDALSPSKHSSDVAMANWGKALKETYPQWVQQVNQTLTKQHILPNLDIDDINQRYQKQGQEKAKEMRKNLIADITGKTPDGNAEIGNGEIMQALSRLLANAELRPEMSQHIIKGNANGPIASTDDIIQSLSQIKHSTEINQETGYRELSGHEKTLAQQLITGTDIQSKSLDSQTQSAISLLSMMFDKLLQEEQIAEPIKPLINELQMPILKMAVTNHEFFSNPDNAAQELLNEVAKAGAHWTPKQNIAKDPFYKKITSIVDDINASTENPDGNEFVFDEKLQELKEFIEKEDRRSTMLEERIIQAESVKARTDAARLSAERIINRKIMRHNAQPHTAGFLQNYWAQVIFFFLNRDGDYDSPEQTNAKDLMESLLVVSADNLGLDIDQLFVQLLAHLQNLGLEITDQPLVLGNIRQEINQLKQKAELELAAAAAEKAAAEKLLADQKAAIETEAARLKAAAEQAMAEQAAAEAESARLKAAAERAALEEEKAKQAAAREQEAAAKQAAEQAAAALKVAAEKAAAEQAAAQQEAARLQAAAEKAAAEEEAKKIIAAEQEATRLRIAAEQAAAEQAAREARELEDKIAESAALEPEDEDPSIEDRFSQQADILRAESWFRFTNESSEVIKIKLAAIIKHNGNYIFVNRDGMKVITTKKTGVADMLRSGTLKMVDDAVFFDRALESVIQSLRR